MLLAGMGKVGVVMPSSSAYKQRLLNGDTLASEDLHCVPS